MSNVIYLHNHRVFRALRRVSSPETRRCIYEASKDPESLKAYIHFIRFCAGEAAGLSDPVRQRLKHSLEVLEEIEAAP